MHGIAEWIENGSDIVADFRRNFVGILRRNTNVLGKRARAIDPDTTGIAAQMSEEC